MKVFSLHQEMQDKKEAENWWNDYKYTYWGLLSDENMKTRKQEMYDEIQRQNLREGVLKKVMEMFDRQYGRPLQ